jgi:hypothetical protein
MVQPMKAIDLYKQWAHENRKFLFIAYILIAILIITGNLIIRSQTPVDNNLKEFIFNSISIQNYFGRVYSVNKLLFKETGIIYSNERIRGNLWFGVFGMKNKGKLHLYWEREKGSTEACIIKLIVDEYNGNYYEIELDKNENKCFKMSIK